MCQVRDRKAISFLADGRTAGRPTEARVENVQSASWSQRAVKAPRPRLGRGPGRGGFSRRRIKTSLETVSSRALLTAASCAAGDRSGFDRTRSNPAAVDLDLSFGQRSDDGRVKLAFSHLDALMQCLGGIIVQHRNGSLSNDRT